ncbi:MAG: 50S ribosomal protein L11 methyltransferase [Acidobacteria bacterium]|nr:50S ribosomal protein L11 methyltransferase [Acidobacteriota bacterium]
MVALHIRCELEDKDRILAELWERGTEGVVEEDLPGGGCRLRAYFNQTFDAAEWNGEWRAEEERDWVAVSREGWEPLEVGRRFYLVPAWRDDPAPAGRLRLPIDSGLACGTGYHQATQLCLEALERWLRPGDTLIDVGTGSGILAEAGLLLGAGAAIGCDIEPDAVLWAREHTRAHLFAGSLRSVRDAAADTVVANINQAALVALAADLRRVCKPGGRLILGGFRTEEMAAIVRAIPLPCLDLLEMQGWNCLVCGE